MVLMKEITKLVAISDTHNRHRDVKVPKGDVLIHCGDFLGSQSEFQLKDFLKWFSAHPHELKILIAGNHDGLVESDSQHFTKTCSNLGITYLQDREFVWNDIKFYGTPYTPEFNDWFFSYKRGIDAKLQHSKIPSDTDVLITHGPPMFILDKAFPDIALDPPLGCENLTNTYLAGKIAPKIHFFGHIHGSYGSIKKALGPDPTKVTHFLNCSQLDESYNVKNPPHIISLAGPLQLDVA